MIEKLSTKQILNNNLSRTPPSSLEKVIIVLHNIRSMYNVGSVFRSADAFGIKELWLSGYTPTPPRPEITKTAIGAEEFIHWTQIDDLADALHSIKTDGYQVIGMEQTNLSENLPEFIPESDKIVLVMGSEVTGIDNDILPHLDNTVEIPQYGHKHSLNISVAAGIGMYALLSKWYVSS
jgi:23S rRNA (guanosine2251-2'-O)-methyltransferase